MTAPVPSADTGEAGSWQRHEDPYEAGKRVRRVIDALPPNTWDAHVWLESGNHVGGRIDSADVNRIVVAVLAAASLRVNGDTQ